jgi:hypothetical protein
MFLFDVLKSEVFIIENNYPKNKQKYFPTQMIVDLLYHLLSVKDIISDFENEDFPFYLLFLFFYQHLCYFCKLLMKLMKN